METRLYLDKRYGKNSSFGSPLKIAVTAKKKKAFILTGIKIPVENWDADKEKVVKHPEKHNLNTRINVVKCQVDAIIRSGITSGDIPMDDVNAIKRYVDTELHPEVVAKQQEKERIEKAVIEEKKLFLTRYNLFMSRHSDRTKAIYEATLRKIKKYAPESIDTLKFEDITIDWLNEFDRFLAQTTPSVNARNIHFRNIRAVFNDAIDNDITTSYPFRRFKMKTEKTRKRSFDVATLRKIFYAGELEEWEERYRDCFKLMFMLIGINIIDLCHATPANIVNGRLEFRRAKTHRLYSIKIEPEAQAIIDKYKGEKFLLNYLDTCKNYRHFYFNMTKGLASIKNKLNQINDGKNIELLTSYWSRHSWATLASKLNISKDTIAHALGHGENTVTDIYIDYDISKVDEANRVVLDYVLYGNGNRNKEK